MRPLGDVQRGYQCEQAMIVVGGESKLEALLIFGRLSPLSPYFSLLLQKRGEKKKEGESHRSTQITCVLVSMLQPVSAPNCRTQTTCLDQHAPFRQTESTIKQNSSLKIILKIS